MFSLKPQYVALALAALLSACGGGGGGGTTATPTSFKDITVPATFSWSTTAVYSSPQVTVTRTSGTLGTVKILVSNIQTTDPSDSTVTLPEPVRAGLIVSAVVNNDSGPSQTAKLGDMTLPAALTTLLVEVLDADNPGSTRLAYKAVTPQQLASGVSLSF